ncbi:hypothetical protein KNP414_03546 [Paenibacillus mucilaginosus KNP414]|uniref:Uncharacterized protein n=1 Tax=Paenibacillus mucilaginosus (strain KNP414) TaxID=1036673 RepID=F8FBC3_PAEMK|nr:hypothetical protein KNP414_03546 [Paenibacillus mucilaginosus KNP414]
MKRSFHIFFGDKRQKSEAYSQYGGDDNQVNPIHQGHELLRVRDN